MYNQSFEPEDILKSDASLEYPRMFRPSHSQGHVYVQIKYNKNQGSIIPPNTLRVVFVLVTILGGGGISKCKLKNTILELYGFNSL